MHDKSVIPELIETNDNMHGICMKMGSVLFLTMVIHWFGCTGDVSSPDNYSSRVWWQLPAWIWYCTCTAARRFANKTSQGTPPNVESRHRYRCPKCIMVSTSDLHLQPKVCCLSMNVNWTSEPTFLWSNVLITLEMKYYLYLMLYITLILSLWCWLYLLLLDWGNETYAHGNLHVDNIFVCVDSELVTLGWGSGDAVSTTMQNTLTTSLSMEECNHPLKGWNKKATSSMICASGPPSGFCKGAQKHSHLAFNGRLSLVQDSHEQYVACWYS